MMKNIIKTPSIAIILHLLLFSDKNNLYVLNFYAFLNIMMMIIVIVHGQHSTRSSIAEKQLFRGKARLFGGHGSCSRASTPSTKTPLPATTSVVGGERCFLFRTIQLMTAVSTPGGGS